MKKFLGNNSKSNYDKFPIVQIPGEENSCVVGWDAIIGELKRRMVEIGNHCTLIFECYQGVMDSEVLSALTAGLPEATLFESKSAMKVPELLYSHIKDDITDDEIFGYMTRHTMGIYFDEAKVQDMRKQIANSASSCNIVYGTGASYIHQEPGLLVYLDMARWEIQQRFRRNEATNVGFENYSERTSLQYKQAFFVDWRVCDRWKKQVMNRIDLFLDTNEAGTPKLATAQAIRRGLQETVSRPFRVVPFFDPGPWGGQWMKEVCNLDPAPSNYAWCFDCVPEENSLFLGFGDVRFELPSIDLVFAHPETLLGTPVHARFGDEFPIRFDFLDTMEGGNLSLQVHPLTEYIQEKFGMHYTQDESYYILDAAEDAKVYLGLKDGVNPEDMIQDLCQAQETGVFDAEKHVGVYPVKKHDHVLIPSGTIHCSGTNSMVLEISATPFIFTFKLWDWGRLGLDGRPRPINIEHGKHVIQWNRTESWAKKESVNAIYPVAEGEGWREEHTGLHEREFIETRRHWFTGKTTHETNGSVQVLNLVEGREVIVESPLDAFAPFVVHYAETFIVPASVGTYTIRPYGESEGKECATIKAYVRK